MEHLAYLAVLAPPFLVAGIVTAGGLGLMLRLLPDGWFAAHSGPRSNHIGKPRQIGGLVLFPVVLAVGIVASGLQGSPQAITISLAVSAAGLFLLFAVGAIDDFRGLSVAIRLLVQAAAAALLVASVMTTQETSQAWLLPAICLMFLVYWINTTNFMDGLDLLSVAGLAPGLIAAALLLADTSPSDPFSAILAAAAGGLAGFALHNKPPATVFLGDSGSLLLGGLSATGIVLIAGRHSLLVALLPFAYHLVDATSTLAWRLARGERFWEPHSRHAYQVAYRGGLSAGKVSAAIGIFSLACSVIALWAAGQPPMTQLLMFAAGMVACTLLVVWFRKSPESGQRRV